MTTPFEKFTRLGVEEPIAPAEAPIFPEGGLPVMNDAQVAAARAMMDCALGRNENYVTVEALPDVGPDRMGQRSPAPIPLDEVMVSVSPLAPKHIQHQDGSLIGDHPTEAVQGDALAMEPNVEAGLVESTVPWPDPVDGKSLANEIRSRLESHVVFQSAHHAVLVTLWIFGTYCMPAWRLWPRLLITAAVFESGKSTLLEIVHAFVFRGTTLSNCTAATVFRILSQVSPTLCLDEADTWLKNSPGLGGILNASHVRSQARVARVGPRSEVEIFDIWSPIAISGIGTQKSTLVSRSLVIPLQPKLPSEHLEPVGFDIFSESGDTRRRLLGWALEKMTAIKASTSRPPECRSPRRRDNYGPLYQLAAILGGPWPQLLEDAYHGTMETDDGAKEMPEQVLLRDIWGMFTRRPTKTALRTAEIVQYLSGLEESPWAPGLGSRGISPHKIAQMLKPFSIRSHDKRDGIHVAKAYMRLDVELAYNRYAATGLKRNG